MTVGVENYGLSRQFLRKKSANILLKFFFGIFLWFFRVFSHKTDKSEAKEPKAKISCCSKNDLKMI
jgi:hypothetical protein